jgi:hypothetical protein
MATILSRIEIAKLPPRESIESKVKRRNAAVVKSRWTA